MRTALFCIGLIAASTLLGSCATMSEEECLAGDWGGRGFADGAAGYAQSRLGEHAEACTKHGITPDDSAYRAGWAQGVLRYCTLPNGFVQGREGSAYNGVCPADLEEKRTSCPPIATANWSMRRKRRSPAPAAASIACATGSGNWTRRSRPSRANCGPRG